MIPASRAATLVRTSALTTANKTALGIITRSFMGGPPVSHVAPRLLVPAWATQTTKSATMIPGLSRALFLGRETKPSAFLLTGTAMRDGIPQRYVSFVPTRLLHSSNTAGTVITTSCEKDHAKMRAEGHCEVREVQGLEQLLKPGDKVVGQVRLRARSPYFGGSPTIIFSKLYAEQIFADPLLLVSTSAEWNANATSVPHGARLASDTSSSLVKGSDGKSRTVCTKIKSFINSTIHIGVQQDAHGKEWPLRCYTPGVALKHGTKGMESDGTGVTELSDGGTIQSGTVKIQGSSDVLTHWVCNAVEAGLSSIAVPESITGVSRDLNPEGEFQGRTVKPGMGEKVKGFADAMTAAPFSLVTFTAYRNEEGNLQGFMIHNRAKPWPATEILVEFMKEGQDKPECIVHEVHIPHVGMLGDLTVLKLATPVMVESTTARFLDKDGVFKELSEDDPIYQMMLESNKAMRFTFSELKEAGAALGMMISSLGISKTDTRAAVVMISQNGEFSEADLKKGFLELLECDPVSVEHYCCSLAAKLVVGPLFALAHENLQYWEENKDVRDLYDFVTKATPNYLNMEECYVKYAAVIREILKDKPEDLARLREYRLLAKTANDKAQELYDPDDAYEEADDPYGLRS